MTDRQNWFQHGIETIVEAKLDSVTMHQRVPAYNLRGFNYAYQTRVESFGNDLIYYYGLLRLAGFQIRVNDPFKSLTSRYFTVELSNAIDFDEQEDKTAYAAALLKELCSDRGSVEKINDLEIRRVPQPRNFEGESCTQEALIFYHQCLQSFQKTYEHFDLTQRNVKLNNRDYVICKKKETKLCDVLSKQGMALPFQSLIRLWVLRQISLHAKDLNLAHPFFQRISREKLDSLLLSWQKITYAGLAHLARMTPAERIAVANNHTHENPHRLDVNTYRLAQDWPIGRLIYGHAKQDRAVSYNHPKNTLSRLKHSAYQLLNGYTISTLGKMVFDRVKVSKNRIKALVRIQEKTSLKQKLISFVKECFNVSVISISLLLMPALIIVSLAQGITSLPLYGFKKLTGIKPGYSLDKRLSLLESIKDLVLISWMGYQSLLLLSSLESLAMALAPSALNTMGWVSLLPIVGVQIVIAGIVGIAGTAVAGAVYFIHPKEAVSILSGVFEPLAEFFKADQKLINAIPLLGMVGLVITSSSIATLATAAYYQLKTMSQKVIRKIDHFNWHARNLNHSPEMRKLLGKLALKQDNGESFTKEQAEVVDLLLTCEFNKDELAQLKQRIDRLKSDAKGDDKLVFIKAKQAITRAPYLPSYDMVNALKGKLDGQGLKAIKDKLDRVSSAYESKAFTLELN